MRSIVRACLTPDYCAIRRDQILEDDTIDLYKCKESRSALVAPYAIKSGDPDLEWLMRSIFVSTGERYPNGVIIRFWRVL